MSIFYAYVDSLQKNSNKIWIIHIHTEFKNKRKIIYYCLLNEWNGYLPELYKMKQAWTQMCVISRHMSLLYWAICINMIPPGWFGGRQDMLQSVPP